MCSTRRAGRRAADAFDIRRQDHHLPQARRARARETQALLPEDGPALDGERPPCPAATFPNADFEAWFAEFRASVSWLPSEIALGYARRYGARAAALLGDARSRPISGAASAADFTNARLAISSRRNGRRQPRISRPPHQTRPAHDESRTRGVRGRDGRRRALNKPRLAISRQFGRISGSSRLIRSTCRRLAESPMPRAEAAGAQDCGRARWSRSIRTSGDTVAVRATLISQYRLMISYAFAPDFRILNW